MIKKSATSVYYSAEGHTLFTRAGIDRGGTGLIFCHARGDNWRALDAVYPYTKILRRVVELGIPVLCPDLGGTTTWGNSTVISRIGTAFSFMQSHIGVRDDRLLLAGTSMGHLNAANYALQNLSLVKGILGMFPVTDLPAMRGTYGAEIDTAYGGNPAYEAALSTSDPSTYGPSMTVPTYLLHSTGDGVVLSSDVNQYAALAPNVTAVATATAGPHVTCTLTEAEIQAAAEWIVARA